MEKEKFEFVPCNNCCSTTSDVLCDSCARNRYAIKKLNEQLKNLEHEIEIDNRLIEDYNKLLNSIPECVVHGKTCITHAIEWIERVKTLGNVIFNRDNGKQ